METQSGDSVKLGEFTYSQDGANAPAWMIAQWNSKHCLWNERKQSDRYTITDGITKTVTYNPEDCSVSMRLNAAEVYGGTNIGFEIHGNYVIARLPSKIISSPHTG